MTNTIDFFKDKFEHLQARDRSSALRERRENGFTLFSKLGIPARHEEWKYTRIAPLFNKDYAFAALAEPAKLNAADLEPFRLPGHEQANELLFVNGRYNPTLSHIQSKELMVMSMEEAAGNEFREIVATHLGHSSHYLKDGINALNLAFMQDSIFIAVPKGVTIEHPVHIYNISDARQSSVFSQPRSLVHLARRSELQMVETFITLGEQESFSSQVMEIVVEEDAVLGYYKIQNDGPRSHQVSTTHIRQTGKSYTYVVTISLDGGIVRNNTNVVLEAAHCEAHLYGLYFPQGNTHIDNHTVVDNVMPHCYSNELYKGILNDNATGVFNGKIYVRQQAQKTNAYQSNKNILLSGSASVNTKPQLEIFADDVKCSHGCTIGQLDETAMFYLRSRGLPDKMARSLLLHGFVMDILDKIKPLPIRSYADHLISDRLELM